MVRQISWPRILAEGGAIVVSILLAFGIQAWWDSRQEREAAREALLLIRADLVADTAELTRGGNFAEGFYQSASWLVDHYDDPTVTPEDLDNTLGQFLRWDNVQPQGAGYRSAREAGRLGLIENDALRAAIVRYFEEIQPSFVRQSDRVYGEREVLLDALSPHFRWRTLPPTGELPFDTSVRLTSGWQDVQRDNRIYNQVSTVRSASGTAARRARNGRAANDDLRAMIDVELSADPE